MEALNEFRKNYYSTRVMVYDNYMVYSVTPGHSKKATQEANDLIEELDLPLIAQRSSDFSFSISLNY